MSVDYTDTELMDWIEEHGDDISFFRDLIKGTRVEMSACSTSSGCQVEYKTSTLRQAISDAITWEHTT